MAVGAEDYIDQLLVKKYAEEKVDNHENMESMVDPQWMLNACRESILSLVNISTPGWENMGVTCTPASAITSWRREFGRLSWLEMSLNASDLTFVNKSIERTGNMVTVSLPFQKVKKINSMPKKTIGELYNMINDLFQTLNLSISLGDGTLKSGDKVYYFVTFKILSNYDPEVWKEMLTKFSGLEINTILYSRGTWNYEGTIYVQ